MNGVSHAKPCISISSLSLMLLRCFFQYHTHTHLRECTQISMSLFATSLRKSPTTLLWLDCGTPSRKATSHRHRGKHYDNHVIQMTAVAAYYLYRGFLEVLTLTITRFIRIVLSCPVERLHPAASCYCQLISKGSKEQSLFLHICFFCIPFSIC